MYYIKEIIKLNIVCIIIELRQGTIETTAEQKLSRIQTKLLNKIMD